MSDKSSFKKAEERVISTLTPELSKCVPVISNEEEITTIQKEEIYELSRWGFECPSCGNFQETDEDPEHMEEITCSSCNKTFKIVE